MRDGWILPVRRQRYSHRMHFAAGLRSIRQRYHLVGRPIRRVQHHVSVHVRRNHGIVAVVITFVHIGAGRRVQHLRRRRYFRVRNFSLLFEVNCRKEKHPRLIRPTRNKSPLRLEKKIISQRVLLSQSGIVSWSSIPPSSSKS